MRTFLAAVLGSLTIALGGCTLFQPAEIPVSQKLSAQAQTAQKAINEANVTMAAAANVIAQNVTEGIMTKPEAQSALDKLKDYARKVDAAQVLLNGGNILDAKNQAELLASLILTLHREVVARRKQ